MSDPRSKRPLPTRFWLTALTALAWWILTAVFTVADITDDFPRGVTIFSASVCVVLTVLLMLIYAAARWVAPVQEAVGALDTIAVEQRRMSARLDEMTAQRALVRQQVAARLAEHGTNGAGRGLDKSEYYQVYTDVLMDLSGLDQGGDPPAALSN